MQMFHIFIQDLNRRVVKTDAAEIYIPEIEFEVSKQTGLITTVEGIIERAISGLRFSIQNCEVHTPENIQKISSFVGRLEQLKLGNEEFTFVLDDPTGNSFIENPRAPEKDPKMEIKRYARTLEQSKLIGVVADDVTESSNPLLDQLSAQNEILQFAINCSNCTSPCFTNMKVTNIPHFKEIVLMVTLCDKCGYKTNEIKSAGGIEPKGTRHTKFIKTENDLKHDCVKSDTCSLEIPELELRLDSSGNGRYTTIEGLIETVKDQLRESNPFSEGDSEESGLRAKFQQLIKSLDNVVGLTLILDDPCGNSFIENADKSEQYERSNEQNEELGLNDMKTENYA